MVRVRSAKCFVYFLNFAFMKPQSAFIVKIFFSFETSGPEENFGGAKCVSFSNCKIPGK